MDSKETKKWYYVLPVVSIGIFILAWVWLSSAENSMIPTPLATWEKFLNIMTNPISQAILPVHIWVSLRRVLIAFFFAIVLGVGLGVGLGWSKTFNAVVDPIFEMLRPIPPIAWIPLIILWFGIGETSKIIIVFIGSFVPIVLNTYSGIKEIDPLLVSAGKVLGANRRQILLKIVDRSILTIPITSIHTTMSAVSPDSCPRTIRKPTPCFATIISAATTHIHPLDKAVLIPARIAGTVAGSVISSKICLLSTILSKLEGVLCPWQFSKTK